jgi:hypothetical protein
LIGGVAAFAVVVPRAHAASAMAAIREVLLPIARELSVLM